MPATNTSSPPPDKEINPTSHSRRQVSGTGEMADLTRAHDWASTPLGPIDIWSDTLLCSVNIMLSCQFPTVIFWGPEMIQFYNDGYRPLMTEKHPTALGQSARECWKEAWHIIGPQWEAVLANGETTCMKEVLVPVIRNGRLQDIYWTYSYSPIYGPEGTVDGILIVCHDVTDEVLATRKLRESEEALRESETRLSAIYSSSHEYIGILTPAGVLLDCNRAALEFAGNTWDDVIGRNFWETSLFIHTPEGPEMARQAIAQAAAGEFIRKEVALVRPSGETLTFDFSLAPVRDATGKVVFLVPEGRDITELKRAETALIQSEKLAAVGRLASSIAHEINNPLESVMNLIYLARQYAVDPEAQKFLDTADQEIRRVAIIANQTLRFHKQPSNPQAVSCSELVSNVLGIYEAKLRNARIQIEERYRAEHPVLCFEGDIRQVLNNLVGNAIDAMPAGGRLMIRSREATDWRTGRKGVMLTIADTGIGIDPQVRKRIFDPFFTTKGIGGTGLGLWVSQEITERHNGALKVRSSQREGHSGTVFTLFLPFEAATS
jgi:PAS domain S-box-containing protein